MGGLIGNVSFPLEPFLEKEIFHDPHGQISTCIFYIYLFIYSIHTVRVICFDLFLYVWGYSYRKRRLVLKICYLILCRLNLMIIVPKTLMIKMDKGSLLMQASLMIEVMKSFYIKREYDTSLKAMLELRRLILRGSLEIHVVDYMTLMGLLLCISWGSDEFDKNPWEKRVSEEVTRGPNFPGLMFRGRNFWDTILCGRYILYEEKF